MDMYDYRPQRRNHKAHLTSLLLFLLACCCFAVSAVMPKYPVILQLVGIALLVPLIRLVARYLAVQYLYRLRTLEDGTTDLEIYTYRGGAQMQLVARVGLYEITAAAPLTESNRRAPKALKRYAYCPDMAPDTALVLSITNADGDCELMLAPDEKMTEILCAAPTEAVRPIYDPATGEDALPEDAE